MTEERFNEIIALILCSIGLFLLVSFVTYQPSDIAFYTSEVASPLSNKAGLIGAYCAFGLFFTFGLMAYVIPVIFIFWAVCLFMQTVPEKILPKIIGFFVMQLSLSCLASLVQPLEVKVAAGGLVGYVSSSILANYLGFAGTCIYALFCLSVSLLLATDFLLYEVFAFIWEKIVGVYETVSEIVMAPFAALAKRQAEQKKEKKAVKKEAKKQEPAQTKKDAKAQEKEKEKKDPRELLPKGTVKIKKYEDQIKATNKKGAEAEEEDEGLVDIDKELNGVEKVLQSAAAIEDPDDLEELAEEELEDEEEYEEYEDDDEEEEYEDDEDEEDDDDEDEEDDEDVEYDEDEDDEDDEEEDDEEEDDEEEEEEETVQYKFVNVASEPEEAEGYTLPSLDRLKDPVLQEGMSDDLHAKSELIEKRLADFDIHVKVVEVEQGPVITRYEVMPAPGIKLSKIISLQDDIGLAMKTASVRIAPVPGKSTIGIEVPNAVTNIVFLKELLTVNSPKAQKYSLPMYLGKNTSGAPLIADLSDMPHLLIAGTTGSGKTVCVNAIIIGMLYRMDPSLLRFVMIDPKMVELAVYNGIPHLLAPVVTDAKKAASVLNWVVQEMENRYKLLAEVGVRNIRSFNSRTRSDKEEGVPGRLPYIVVVIDELADLMLTAADKVETAIARLAQLSRAVGIHLILATQRPSVNVITGVIKANLPARLSFKVASKVDSRTVLDMIGADKLLGKGDMLFLEPGQAKPARAQSAYIEDKEIKDIVEFIKEQEETQYLDQVQNIVSGKVLQTNMEKDEMYDEAVQVVMQTGQASVSVLQRRLRLGYARAARIVDMMEANGVVGPYQGSKPRDILVDRNTYKP